MSLGIGVAWRIFWITLTLKLGIKVLELDKPASHFTSLSSGFSPIVNNNNSHLMRILEIASSCKEYRFL